MSDLSKNCPRKILGEYMHRKDGVYIHRHREVQREVRVYTKKEEETCESRKKRII